MDKKAAMKAIKDLLIAIGEDPEREGLKDTPRRVAEAFAEFTSGSEEAVIEALSKTFNVEGGDMIIEKDITFSSTCEHHLMPFFGKVAIAYIPNGKVVGLSKLARCVEAYSKNLQLQERLTSQIAEAIMQQLAPQGVLVYCEAEHTCMTCRGVKKPGTSTITYKVLGNFPQEEVSRALAIIKG